MKQFLLCLFSAVCLCLTISTPARAIYNPGDIHSSEELTATVRQLNDSGTEMIALGRLLRFAGIFLGEGSIVIITDDREMDDLRRAAVRAIRAHSSLDVVARALYSSDEDVRLWGIRTFEFTFGQRGPWKFLLPQLEQLAVHDQNVIIRKEAIHKLGYYDECEAFLAALRKSPDEKDPFVLMELLNFNGEEPEQCAAWYARAVKLLADPDAAIRLEWLTRIWSSASNPATAPVYKVHPNPAMMEMLRGIEKQGSSPKEQELAGEALRAFEAEKQSP